MVERREGISHENMYEWPMDTDNSEGIDCGRRGGVGRRGLRGKNQDNCNKENNNTFKKFKKESIPG